MKSYKTVIALALATGFASVSFAAGTAASSTAPAATSDVTQPAIHANAAAQSDAAAKPIIRKTTAKKHKTKATAAPASGAV